ncbi:MAG: phytanoyl-CoA dioxygenase family protein [Methylotenera sp.]
MKRLALNIIHIPIWLLALFTEAKSFQDNPILGNACLNRLGLHVLRVQCAATLANLRRLFLSKYLAKEKQLEYQQNGFIRDFEFLDTLEFLALKKEVFESEWLLREMRQGDTVTRRVFLDTISLVKQFPRLYAFINNPALLSRVRYVAGVGGQPIFSIQAVFSEANETSDPQTVVHADTFHSNAKAWFFLETVSEDGGPLAYVCGSHRLTAQRLAWEKKQSITAKNHPVIYHARGSFRALDEDLREMHLPQPEKMSVPANTLVVADTMGFHCRSVSNKPTCRVEIYATLRRNPFLPWPGLDLFSIPYFKARSGSMSIILLSWLEKIGLRKMPWRLVGKGSIKDPVRTVS